MGTSISLFGFGCHLGKTCALFSADVDKSWLKGLDVEKLQKEFPDRVKVLDQEVHFTGPVCISQGAEGPVVDFIKYSDPLIRRNLQIAVGIMFFVTIFSALTRFAQSIPRADKNARVHIPGKFSFNPFSSQSKTVIALVTGLFAAFVAGKIFDRLT